MQQENRHPKGDITTNEHTLSIHQFYGTVLKLYYTVYSVHRVIPSTLNAVLG
jgi:hypothetical protein